MNIKATIIDAPQGSEAWLEHRSKSLNASDLAAAMGLSKYTTRAELIRRIATGITPEVDEHTQRRFDAGHQAEAEARVLAEEIIGEPLYPVTLAADIDGLRISASLDGQDLAPDVTWEHKRANAELIASLEAGVIPEQYHPQMEQGLMLSGASRCLFMASNGDRESMRYCWYESNLELRAKILPTWKQLMADVAAYVPAEVVEKPVAQAVTALPAVSVQVSGEIAVRDNFSAFEVALRDFIDNRLVRKPETDQDFADLDLQIKALKNAEEALNAAEAQMLAQVASVDTLKRTKDMLHKMARDNRLMAEKLLAARKEEIRGEIVAGGITALREHVAKLNERLGKPYMPVIPADFAGVIKGKRTVDSLRDAVSTELARAKIAANEVADRIDANLKYLRENAAQHAFLFADAATIVLKAQDDLQALVKNRVAEHERIRAEEAARLEREARERQAQADADSARQAQAAIQAVATAAYEKAAPAVTAAVIDMATTGTGMVKIDAEANVTRVAPEAMRDTGNRINLGAINARLAPLSITADGLAQLGFKPVAIDRASKLYREADLPAIFAAIADHIEGLYEAAV